MRKFFTFLLALVTSVGMSYADPGVVSSGTKGGMSYTFYDNGLLEISGSGALPGNAFTNWDGGFGASVKNIRFAEDCEVYGLDYLWFACYTEKSQLETIEINSVTPIMFSGTSGAGISYKQDGAVTITITAPGIVNVESEIVHNYKSPVNMIFNMPATTVFEKKWFSGLKNYYAVTIPTGAKGHIPAGYVFKDSYDQMEYDNFVEMGHEDDFWETHSYLEEGVDYTLGVESTFVITAENASQIFGQATVSFQAPTEASNSEWVHWRKSDLKTFSDMSSGDQKVYKDVTVKVNNGVYDTDSGWGLHFKSLAEDGVQFVAPLGKVFKRIVILNEYGTFSDPNWSYDKNYKKWSGSANTVGFEGDICGITLIEFEVDGSAPANSCGGGLTWELKDGALTISYDGEGTGVMNDFEQDYSPWKDQIASITSVVINEGAKNIGKYAFYECEYITTVTLGNSVETIGEGAFRNCEDLASLELGNNIKTIEQEAFLSCSVLKTVTIGTGITSIGTGAFYGCEELTTVTCEATTPPILGMAVFESCPKLTQIFVPAESVDAYKTAWSPYASLISAAGGGSTSTLKLIEFQVPASWENDNTPISIADFPDFVATTYEIASALPVTSEPSLVVFDFPDDEMSVYTKVDGQVSKSSTGTIVRKAFFGQPQLHYYYPVLAGDEPEPTPTVWTALKVGDVIKVGDKIEVPNEGDGSWGINGNVLRNAWGPYTLIRADIYQASDYDDPEVTETEDGAFYVFKAENSDFYPLSYLGKGTGLVVTMTSDGLVVTAAENKEFTVAVHENGSTPTAVENVQTNSVQATKILRNGQLYIMYKGTMYNVQGARVK